MIPKELEFVNIVSEITKVLCPGSLSLHLSRIDTERRHPHPEVYEADLAFFRTFSNRKVLLREAIEGEFDLATPSSEEFFPEEYPTLQFQKPDLPGEILRLVRRDIPRLWVLVSKIGSSAHQIVTIYRGKPWWKIIDQEARDIAHFDTDAATLWTLEKIQEREGVDKKEWAAFIRTCWDTYESVIAASNKNNKVH